MRLRCLLFAAGLLATSSPLHAAEPPQDAGAPAQAQGSVQNEQELAGQSGGREIAAAMTEQDLTAINTGNRISANSVNSGSISLEGGALSDFNGIGNFTMNTGHNNNLQSSLSVTIIVTK